MTTAKTSTALAAKGTISARLKQDDIDAIETAYSHFLKYKQQNVGNPIDLMFEQADVADIQKSDPAAWAYVSAKHGFMPDGSPLTGFTGTPDPDWAVVTPQALEDLDLSC